ncbi:hypothetical protein CK203_008472 [Vitis vinifera]|uniref:Uncharacterized protein n=1 Tax=Vitis vinifera TaxID=29760 RepID=A0A438KNB4_VITVI|nr:hypothetical protein CK203_008472 [Vitis vinifera]
MGCKVGLWKTICKDWDILSSRVAYSMDNEGRVRFWTDKLCGDKSLRTYFPSYLYSPPLRRLRWRRFGSLHLMRVVRHPNSLGDSMIGK